LNLLGISMGKVLLELDGYYHVEVFMRST